MRTFLRKIVRRLIAATDRLQVLSERLEATGDRMIAWCKRQDERIAKW